MTSSSATWVVSTTRSDSSARAATMRCSVRAGAAPDQGMASQADGDAADDHDARAGSSSPATTPLRTATISEAAQRHPAPQLAVEDAVDVVDHRGEDVAASRTEPAGVSGTSASYTSARRRASIPSAVSCDQQPLDVAQQRPRQTEGADAARSRPAA